MKELREFHTVLLRIEDEGIFDLTPEKARQAKKMGTVFAEYVKEGGGLIIQPRPVRYSGNDDEKYWNLVLEPLGVSIEREGIADKPHLVDHEHKTGFSAKFFHTRNFTAHPLTDGVKGLWLPLDSFDRFPGTPLIKYSPEWTVVVRGEQSAASYRKNAQNRMDLDSPGSIAGAPPIVAVRNLGKGRIACVGVDYIYTGLNLNKPSWSHIAENKGFDGKPGDMMKLMANAVKWTAEPAVGNPELGTYQPVAYKEIVFPRTFNVDKFNFSALKLKQPQGVAGLHSYFSGGENSVQEYAAAAKEAGLGFIVFTDPLERLNPEKLEALKKACREVSSDDFYACPGIEFTDGSGIRWIFAGEKVVWPNEKPFQKDGFTHKIWENGVIKHYGRYAEGCSYPFSAIIDYGDLARNKVQVENLWWFFNVIPYAYEKDQLLADNYSQWQFALDDLRWVAPVSFTRIKRAADLTAAMNTAVTCGADLKSIKTFLNSRVSAYHRAIEANIHTRYGQGTPVNIRRWEAHNNQVDPRVLHTRGVQRVRLAVEAESPNGIKEVKVWDGGRKLLRRFAGNGNVLEQEFELVHDRQHYVYLEVTDHAGNRAISHYIFIYDYKQGLFRCGDNLNILGPLGYYWHPDRNERLPLFKTFRNAELFSVNGWDRGGPDCPVPYGRQHLSVQAEGIGELFPWTRDAMYGMRMATELAGGDLQIVRADMDNIVERFDNANRPGPASCSPPKVLSDNPCFTHTQTMYSPRDRMEHHIAWDHRRLRESLKDYDGSFLYYTGELTFKKDLTLKKDAAIPVELLVIQVEPAQVAKSVDDILLVKDKAQGILKMEMPRNQKKAVNGVIAADGFATLFHSPIGYLGIIPVEGEWRYSYHAPGRLALGIGHPGQEFKAGDKLRYAFISGDFLGQETNSEKLEFARNTFLNRSYPSQVKTGTTLEMPFFFGIAAQNHEAAFTLGAHPGIGMDLPIRVEGLVDNGCAAVFSTKRPWFRFIGVNGGSDAKSAGAWFQEPIDHENQIWAGNVFVASEKNILLTLIADGQELGKQPFLEIHNPTDQELTVTISSPPGTPRFGGKSFTLTVPAGTSEFRTPDGRKILPAWK